MPPRFSAARTGACFLAAALSLSVSACRDGKQTALKELERRGLTAAPETLATSSGQGDASVVRILGEAGVRAPVPAAGEPSALQLAVSKNHWAVLPVLIPLCDAAVLNHAGPGGKTALETVLAAGQFDLAETMLDAGALPVPAGGGTDALMQSAATGKPALTDRLLELLPKGDPALTAALLRAAASGDAARAALTLSRGADANARRHADQDPVLDVAARGGHEPVVVELLKHGAKAAECPDALRHAIQRGDDGTVRRLLEAGAPAESTDGDPEHTPLRLALAKGRLDYVEAMLRHGTKPESCLAAALAAGEGELLTMLEKHGVTMDKPLPDGNPPLHHAVISGKVSLIPKLLQMGAPLDAPGALGQSAFLLAAVLRKDDALRTLAAAGANPNQAFFEPVSPEMLPLLESDHFVGWLKRDDGLTALMLAAARGDAPAVKLLLSLGAKRGAQTKSWKRYPIQFACDTSHLKAAQILLGRNPDEEKSKRRVVISLSKQRASLFKDDQLVRTARVSTGKKSTPTPSGSFLITDKQASWVSSIYEVPMPFFMRLSCKDFGMHQGVVPGYPASHGCIRMPKGDVQAFFRTLAIGDPVTIEP